MSQKLSFIGFEVLVHQTNNYYPLKDNYYLLHNNYHLLNSNYYIWREFNKYPINNYHLINGNYYL